MLIQDILLVSIFLLNLTNKINYYKDKILNKLEDYKNMTLPYTFGPMV